VHVTRVHEGHTMISMLRGSTHAPSTDDAGEQSRGGSAGVDLLPGWSSASRWLLGVDSRCSSSL
jgi:hypothetical protein